MNWNDLFFDSDSFRKKEVVVFDSVSKLLDEGVAVYPDISKPDSVIINFNDFYRALHLTPLDKVKVVILGQDPYHEKGQAHGLAFSTPEGRPIPRSLKNIFKEITAEYGYPLPDSGCLEPWAKQGVFLLNTVLTVEDGNANSHSKCGWQTFTDNVIKVLNTQTQPIVYMLWGKQAEKKKELITNPNHLVLISSHPSPFSARRGFFGCNHFKLANEFLKENKKEEIDWSLD